MGGRLFMTLTLVWAETHILPQWKFSKKTKGYIRQERGLGGNELMQEEPKYTNSESE